MFDSSSPSIHQLLVTYPYESCFLANHLDQDIVIHHHIKINIIDHPNTFRDIHNWDNP